MSIRDALVELGHSYVPERGLVKAQRKEMVSDTGDEGQDRAPGGANEDDADNAPMVTEKAGGDPKSLFWDPFAIIEQLGYKDRPSLITYGTLKAMVWKLPIVQAVIQTRVNQVASFATPAADRYQLGFRIRKRDAKDKKEPTPAEDKFINQAQSWLMRTGVTDNPRGRDDFETFLRKVAWDSLVYDQLTFETVPNKKGQPAEFYAVDGASIRLADTATTYMDEDLTDATRYVQIYDGMVIAEYTNDELFFGVRNPRTDIKLYGYGVSELEMLIPAVTSLLWAWQYNSRFFSQGSAAKGIINFKGAIPDNQLRQFRRMWYQLLSGVHNAWRTPVTNAEELQWVNMQNTNRDMEFNAWMDFLIKVVCSMYSMNPIEVNFQYGNQGQKSSLNEASNKEKITESRERGLRPLLRFISNAVNRQLIWPLNEDFEFAFVGLDADTHEDIAKRNQMRVKTTMTIDELRAEDNLPPLPNGEGTILLDPTFIQARSQKQQEEQMAQQGAGGFGEEGGGEGEGEGDLDFGDIDFEKLLAGEGEPGKEAGGKPAGPPEPAEAGEAAKSMTYEIEL